MRGNWLLLFMCSVVGIAAWIAFTMPDVETDYLDEEDWYDL
jgi:hypothetical protein